jgi:hypothetical protein
MPVKDPRLASHSYRVTVLACSASGTVMSQILRVWYSDRLDRVTVLARRRAPVMSEILRVRYSNRLDRLTVRLPLNSA